MELEYRASQQQQQERSTGGGAQTIEMGGEVESSAASRDAHAKTIDVVSAVPGEGLRALRATCARASSGRDIDPIR